MRIPIVVSVLVLAAAAGLGWRDHLRLASVQATHRELVAQAAALGIALDPADPAERVRTTKRPREDRDAGAKDAAAGFIVYAKEMQALGGKLGMPLDEATRKRMMDQMDRMMALDGSQLKVVIAELCANSPPQIDLIDFSIKRLAKDYPQQALAILTDSPGLLDLIHRTTNGQAENLIQNVLKGWANNDPLAAIEWFRKNGGKLPDYLANPAAWGLISGSASSDPKLAFQLVGELGFDAGIFVPSIARKRAKTPEQRAATLAALREWRAAAPDDKASEDAAGEAIRLLAFGESYQPNDFDHVTRWVDAANFSPQELESLTQGVERSLKLDETGKWIEWLGKTLLADAVNEFIFRLVSKWSERNYEAAGNWLATAPASPARHIAACAYAETIITKDPATAIEWALSVPEGEERDRTLKKLYEKWPKEDSAARHAFAEEHGIK